jgi:hypothetical protein
LTQRTTLAALQQLAPLQPLAPLNPLAQQVGFHVAFVAEYVSFQLNLFVNLATIRVAAVGAFAPASYEGGAVNTHDDAAESVRDVKVSPTTRASTERPKKPKPFGVKVRLQRESRGETSTDTTDVDGGGSTKRDQNGDSQSTADVSEGAVLWVVGFVEHLELNAVGVLERQYRAVFSLGDRRVSHSELLEPRHPLVEVGPRVDFEPHVIEPGTPGIEGFPLVPVVLLALDDGSRRRMHEQDGVPPIAVDPVDFGQLEQRCPPSGTRLGVTDGKRNMRHLAESWHGNSFGFTFGCGAGVRS